MYNGTSFSGVVVCSKNFAVIAMLEITLTDGSIIKAVPYHPADRVHSHGDKYGNGIIFYFIG